MAQILKKELSRVVKLDKEIVINQYYRFKNKKPFLSEEDLEYFTDWCADEDEYWMYGFGCDEDGELTYIDFSKLYKYLVERLVYNEKEFPNDIETSFLKDLKEKIEPYKDFDLWL